jgi:uncharacterized protein (DUF1697 family)
MPPRQRSTATLVALLRGINVGKAKRVAMAELRKLFEELGYTNVRTLLNSGNVVYRGRPGSIPHDEKEIEEAMLVRFGFTARITVIDAAELAEAIAGNPFVEGAKDPSRLLVAFLNKADDRVKLAELARREWGSERLSVGKRVAYLWCGGGIIAGRLWEEVGRALKDGVTSRNWATVTKLAAMMEE